MTFNKDSAVEAAKKDLAERLNVGSKDINVSSVSEEEFSDMSLGAPASDEMAAQMIASGWCIRLETGGSNYEYRADKYQLRLKNFKGSNIVVQY